MFDVFYSGIKPNLFAHEREADSIEHAQELSRTRYFWWVNYLTDYTDFDFLWEPVPWQNQYTHVWPSQWDQFHGACLVPKTASALEYHTHTKALPAREYRENFKTLIPCEFDYSWTPHPWDPPYIYVFGNQWWSAIKQPTVEYHAPGATERKYMPFPRAEILPTTEHWSVPADIDTTDFDFSWCPDPGDPPYIYQFGTQHQRTGGPVYSVPGATDVKYVDQIRARTSSKATAIYEIDHIDGNSGQIPNTTKSIRYVDNYLDTLRRIAKSIPEEHEFVWICSSICDYTNFDFSWHPEQWQATMLHVFASDEQKFGDTFFMHVPTFKMRTEKLELLDWYDINFIDKGVPRRPLPVLQHTHDTHVDAIRTMDWAGPLAVFTTADATNKIPTVPLWREKTKTVVPLSLGATQVIIPKNAVPYIKEQVYDYPYIDRTYRTFGQDIESDVIFISNGETMADANWTNLLELCPRAKRSDGVTGREAAYKAAAEMSSTPWFFAVFAKTEVLPSFKFDYQPDRLQQPRHYIFHSRNPLNGLEYGAMNINLYNRQLTLDTRPGIDFTLSSLHTVVPICASISRFNTDPWVTWRSAFREVLKLKLEVDNGADVEIQYRLKVWCTLAEGDNAEYCLAGANDALEYYEKVNGNYDKLCLSFDWAWLQEYYFNKYNQELWLQSI